jgi:hypothetical protein
MKTFNEWLIEKDPEFLDETAWDNFKRAGQAAAAAAAFTAGAWGAPDQASAHQPVPPSMVQTYRGQYSPVKFDVAHAVEVMGLSSKYLSTPEKVYKIMMDKFKLGRFEDDEYSKFFEKYKESDPNNPRKWIANPPACC